MACCDHGSGSNADVAAARAARTAGEWDHAGRHLASALAVDPHDAAALAELDALIDAAGDDPGAIAPIAEPEPWYGTVALHARILARHDVTTALDLLCQVAAMRPDVPYLDWALDWIGPTTPVDPGRGHVALARTLTVESPPWTPAVVVPLFRTVSELARRLRDRAPDAEGLVAVQAIAARRAGDWEEALAVARDGYERLGTYAAAIALANVRRARGEVDEALAMYRTAVELASDPVPALLDLGDTLLEADRLEECEAVYQEVLALEPEQEWACAVLHYLGFVRRADPDARDALRALSRSNPHDPRPAGLVDAVTPWVGFLPPPTEQAVNTLRRLTAQYAPGSIREPRSLPIRTRWLEAPSVHLAAAWTARLYDALEIAVDAEQVGTPDPRLPLTSTGLSLWSWRGTQPRPALPPPPAAVTDAIASLAARPFHLPSWRAGALEVARTLAGARIQDVLAAAVHPPEPPATFVPWAWVQRYQMATAFVLAAWVEDTSSPAWLALEAMALGPADWTACAGIVAMGELALEHDHLVTTVRDLLLPWLGRKPEHGPWCVEEALVYTLLRLPGLPTTTRRSLENRRHRLEHTPPQRRVTG